MSESAIPAQTAEQINGPQVGRISVVPAVRITDTDPGRPGLERSAVALKPDHRCSLELKLPRDKMVAAIKNARQVPLEFQSVLLALVALVPEKHELLRLDFIFHGHGAGFNFSGTVKELS